MAGSRLIDVHQRTTAALRPLATAVAKGTIHFATDTGALTRSDGTVWESYSAVGGGTGDVVGPAVAVDGNVALFDGITGKLLKDGGPRRIIQVVNFQTGAVNSGTTLTPADDTIPQNTEGIEVMTLVITPTSALNKLLIEFQGLFASGTASRYVTVALFQDSIANALAATGVHITSTNGIVQIPLSYYMVAGTISPITFKIRAGLNSAATLTFNGVAAGRLYGGITVSSITITEIAA